MSRIRVLLLTFLPITIILSIAGCTRDRDLPGLIVPTTPPPVAESGATPTPFPDTGVQDFDYTSEAPVTEPKTYFVKGELLIKFKEDVVPELPTEKRQNIQGLSIGSAQLDPLFQEMGITSLEPLLAPVAQASGQGFRAVADQAEGLRNVYVAEFDVSEDAVVKAAALQNNANIEYAEPNFVAFITDEPAYAPNYFTPNDQHFGFQWNFQAIQMEAAWDISRGDNVTVAILDTGVAYENFDGFQQAPDLAGTQFVQGYDFVNNDSHPNDDQGHGTHVAGTVAQTTDNGFGVAGVAFRARVMPIKVLDDNGQGGYDNIAKGIHYAVYNGAKVINLSLAGYSGSRTLEDAVNFAHSRGVTVVAAAGNNGGAVGYPAVYDRVLAVGAVRYDLTRAGYSNFGPQIDLVAPGGDNSVDQNNDNFGDGIVQQTFKAGQVNNFRFLFFEGTSMAAPHVAGVAALLLSQNPSLTPLQVRDHLITSARDLGPSNFDNEYGYGLVQAANALAGPATPTPTATNTPGGPTPTPTATPVPVTPGPGTDTIQNGGFESSAAWKFVRTPCQADYSTARARTGARSARIGIVESMKDRFCFSSIAQQVTISADATAATLTAHVFPITQQNPAQFSHRNLHRQDLQLISILDHRFREVERLDSFLSNSQTWEQKTFDLTKYKGRTIYIYFGVVNRGPDGKTTAMFVDDVTLVVAR